MLNQGRRIYYLGLWNIKILIQYNTCLKPNSTPHSNHPKSPPWQSVNTLYVRNRYLSWNPNTVLNAEFLSAPAGCIYINLLKTKRNPLCIRNHFRTAQYTLSTTVKKANQLTMYKAKVAVCSDIRTKHSTQSERHVEFLNVKPGGT